jgi:hypothetical protein
VIFSDYSEKIRDLCEFLSRYNTEQSVSLQGEIDKRYQEIQTKVKLCFEEMKNLLSAKVEDTSNGDQIELHVSAQPVSGRNHRSSSAGSSLRFIHAQKKAKAEAARTKLEFLEKEKELQTKRALLIEQNQELSAKTQPEKSVIEAELKILDKKEAAAAIAEAEILKDAMRDMGRSVFTGNSVQRLGSVDRMGRVDHYVREQNKLNPLHILFSKSDTKKRLAFYQYSEVEDEHPAVRTPVPSSTKPGIMKRDASLDLSSDSDGDETPIGPEQKSRPVA